MYVPMYIVAHSAVAPDVYGAVHTYLTVLMKFASTCLCVAAGVYMWNPVYACTHQS